MEKQISNAASFFKRKKNIFRFHLLPFLSVEENLNLSIVNSTFNKSIKENFREKLSKLSSNLSLDISENDERLNKDILKTIKKMPGFLVNNTKANYVQFMLNDSYRYLALICGESWVHSENPENWEKAQLTNSSFGKKTAILRFVCFVDLILNFHSVEPGMYDVYLHQTLKERNSMANALSLNIIVESWDDEDSTVAVQTELYKSNFMSKEMALSLAEENKDSKYMVNKTKCILFSTKTRERSLSEELIGEIKLQDTYITTIDLTKFSKKVKVKIAFRHENGWWKNGWFIDAGILQRRK